MIHTTQHLHLQLIQKITEKPTFRTPIAESDMKIQKGKKPKTENGNTHQNLERKGLKERPFRI